MVGVAGGVGAEERGGGAEERGGVGTGVGVGVKTEVPVRGCVEPSN